MVKYPIVLLDADHTLFDFNAAELDAVILMLRRHGLEPSDENIALYRRINGGYWHAHERGEIGKERLLEQRFEDLFGHFGVEADCAEANRLYLADLGEGSALLDGAMELCRDLAPRHRLYIVTNGTELAQGSRYKKAGLDRYLSGIFISDVIGVPKPHKGFFDAVFQSLGHPPKDEIIILGDSLVSDMKGGRNAGIATCWFSPQGGEPNGDCDYVIRRLEEFKTIVG